MGIHFGDGRLQALIMLTGAVAGLYAASRIAGLALDREEASIPGRRAIAQWLPIAGATLVAVCFGRADIALSLIFSTSVGFLLLVFGLTTWLTPLQTLPPSRNVWPFIFPAALLILMAGISSHLTWWHALMMLALGGAILGVWVQTPAMPVDTPGDPPFARRRNIVMVGVLALTVVGSVLAVSGVLAACSLTNSQGRLISPGIFAAAILSPLLIVPTLGTASAIAQRGQPGQAVTALIGSVLLNLCLLLPIAVLLWHLDPGQWNPHAMKFFNIHWNRWHSMPFDLAAWQIETVTLVVIGFALVPVAIGRWSIGRLESSMLVLAYGGYMFMLVLFGIGQR